MRYVRYDCDSCGMHTVAVPEPLPTTSQEDYYHIVRHSIAYDHPDDCPSMEVVIQAPTTTAQ